MIVAAMGAGCDRGTPPAGNETAGPAAATDPRVQQARDLMKRAEAAPLPTPLPPPSPIPRGWKPGPAPEFKPEEIEAVRLLEQSAAANPRQMEANDLLARALEPHAIRAHDRAAAVAAAKGNRKASPPPTPPDQGIDASPARVARAYRAAVEAAPTGGEELETLIRFGTRVEELDAVDWAHQELIRRAKENATAVPLTRYGDFLRDVKKDVPRALEQYRNALIWSPDDAALRAKVADIYLGLAKDHLARQEYAATELNVREAAKYVSDRASTQGRMLADFQKRLAEIRR